MATTTEREVEFVRRPGLGTRGRRIRVRSNYFEILSLPENYIIHYDVTITPDVPPILNRKVYKAFEGQYRNELGGAKPVFDGRKNIFSPRPLPFGDAHTFNVILGDGGPRRQPNSFQIHIKRVGEIGFESLLRFLNDKGSMTHECSTAIMALDVLIRHLPSMLYETFGRAFYTSEGAQSLSGGAEVWQGYYQSARPTLGRMMINVDLSATAFYESGSLVNMVARILGRRPDDLRRGLRDVDIKKLEKSLKNLKIRVIHRGDQVSRRRYKISSLTPAPASQQRFDQDGQLTDVATYFYEKYHQRLDFPSLPCVVVRRDIFLPIEVCHVIEGQRHMRKLNEKQTADMIKFTCQNPSTRANKIRRGVEILNYRGNEYLQQFGVRVSNEMATVNARVLPIPSIEYNPSSKEPMVKPRDGVWNLRDKKVATGTTLGSWSVVVFGSEREYRRTSVQQFVRELINVCHDTGMNIVGRNPEIEYANQQGTIEDDLKKAWLTAGNSSKSQPQLILCILPNTGKPLYAEIKRVSDTVIGVATQCCQSKNLARPNKQYLANVCLKINVKLGGMNSSLESSHLPFVVDRPTIIMGADTTHPPAGDTNRPTIAAVCASMDAKASRYSASIRIQAGRTEAIVDLANMVKELLKTFYQTCGRKPERILFYRDGISEGQFTKVLEKELGSIIAACQALDTSYRPTITFVVVQKRHHTRFFPLDRADADRTGNCSAGTVVESDITHPFEFDFYLQSQAGLQGTSRPAHYHVLHDENNFNPDLLQTLSYNLCYLHARCTRSVSLVPPVYYAHIVCSRARFHAKGEHWSDTDSSEGAGESSYAAVKQELQKVMYFM